PGRGSYPPERPGGTTPPAPILPRHRRARNVMPNFRPLALLCSIGLVLTGAGAAQEKTAKKAGLDWWSLQKLSNPSPPQVHNPAWLKDPIDAFILANLEARGLSPAPPADRATLIPRVPLDLLGLPPPPAEIDAFFAAPSPQACA